MAPTGPDQLALLNLLSKLRSSSAMTKMADATKKARDLGLDQKLVDALVPVLCRFVIAHQASGKLQESAEFVAHVVASAAELAPDLVGILEGV